MRPRLVLMAAIAAVTATLTIGPAAPAAAPAGSHAAGKHHVDRVPVPPMHSMCGGEVV
jgi:hypothetical protein